MCTMGGCGWAFCISFFHWKSICALTLLPVCPFHFEFYLSFLKEGGKTGMPTNLTGVHHRVRMATGIHKGVLLFFLHFSSVYIPSCTSVQFSPSVVSNSLQPHWLQHARPPCPSPTPKACSNSCPSSQWCHWTMLSSVVLFSSCLLSLPTSGSFSVSHFFTSGSQSIGASASAPVLPKNIQDWLPLGLTGLISLQS